MEYDKDKVDELVLTLLYLTTHDQGPGTIFSTVTA
jgi:hypothetical protein